MKPSPFPGVSLQATDWHVYGMHTFNKEVNKPSIWILVWKKNIFENLKK